MNYRHGVGGRPPGGALEGYRRISMYMDEKTLRDLRVIAAKKDIYPGQFLTEALNDFLKTSHVAIIRINKRIRGASPLKYKNAQIIVHSETYRTFAYVALENNLPIRLLMTYVLNDYIKRQVKRQKDLRGLLQ